MSYKPKNMSDACFLADETVSNGLKMLRAMFVGGVCLKAFVSPKHCLDFMIMISDYDMPTESGMLLPTFDEKTKAKIQKIVGLDFIARLEAAEIKHIKEFLPKIEDTTNKEIDKIRAKHEYGIARLEAVIANMLALPQGLTPKEQMKLMELQSYLQRETQKRDECTHFKLIRKEGKLNKLMATFNYVYWFVCIEYAMTDGFRETIVYPTENPKYLEWCKLPAPRPVFLHWIKEQQVKEEV